MRILTLLMLLLAVAPLAARAEPVTVACAANFTAPMKRLAALYGERAGVAVEATFGSTGMLYGQIHQGAPFDLFFAADADRPARLHAEGLAEAPRTYALGQVVLWSASAELAAAPDWRAAAAHPSVRKLGLASPGTAPYGTAAEQALRTAGLYEGLADRLVFAKNVGQSFQFAWSLAADAAFVALSQARSEKGAAGRTWDVPEAASITQDACLLGRAGAEAAGFLRFVLADPAARELIMEYGYK